MPARVNVGQGGGDYPPPSYPPTPKQPGAPSGNSLLGSNPGLLTSTGGLFGVGGVLLTPVTNNTTGKSSIIIMDPSNFNCEDDGEYDFPQLIPSVQTNSYQEGCKIDCSLLKLKYREIGYAQFTINITTFDRDTDTFTSYPYIVKIPSIPLSTKVRKQSFPDGRIHTRFIPIQVTGERPQVTTNFNGGSGAHSIISITLCGYADETPQV